MTPSRIRAKVVADRASWIRRMLDGIRGLPTESPEAFAADPRTAAAAESYLRRALEALLDLGRHVLAKGFGRGVAEYKEVPAELLKNGVLTPAQAGVLREMAGYRNRMVHFYDEVEVHELYEICTQSLDDIEATLDAILAWIDGHPEFVEPT